MSALPVEVPPDDEVVVLLEASVLQELVRTVSFLPPGTPLVLHARPGGRSSIAHATAVQSAVSLDSPMRTGGSLALVESLSIAERRVLQYLRTHLTLAEIAARLFVSRNTVKSQAISIYRKLGVCSRSEAVRVAIEADLSGARMRTLPLS